MSDQPDGKDDAQLGEGGLLATVTEHAPDSWRAKLAKVAVQLIAGTEMGATLYGKARERLDTIEGRSFVSKALAQTVADQAVKDPEVVERARARFLGSVIQKQENLEAVIAGAGEHLPRLPAPATIDTEETVGEATSEGNVGYLPDDAPLDPDWAATFTDIAENATSEELRDRLSRILAGELQSPGAYSRSTVRAIAELEKRDLQAMQAVMPYILGNEIVRAELPKQFPDVNALLPLVDAGLITDANPMLEKSWGPAKADGQSFVLDGQVWGLIIEMKVKTSGAYPVVPLTRTGSAVADLLGRHDERPVLRRIAEIVEKGGCISIRMGPMQGSSAMGSPFETLFPKPTTVTMPPPNAGFGPVTLDGGNDAEGQ